MLMEVLTPRQVARECLEEAGNDRHKAAQLLKQRADADQDLFNKIMAPGLMRACVGMVSEEIIVDRRESWTPPTLKNTKPKQPPRNIHAAVADRLMRFPLLSGRALGDATRNEVADAAEFFRKQSSDMAWKARWLGKIVAELPARKKVRNVLTEADLERLQEETAAPVVE